MAQNPARGPLILLGSDGLRTSLQAVLKQTTGLVSGATQRAGLITTALNEQKPGAAGQTIAQAAAALSSLGIASQVIQAADITAGSSGSTTLDNIDSFFLLSGEPESAVRVLTGSPLWQQVLVRHAQGAALVATGGSASALGALFVVPRRTRGPVPEPPQYSLLPSLNLVPATMLLPYFNWLPSGIRQQIDRLIPPDIYRIGLDVETALIAAESTWMVLGSGSVAVWQSGQPATPTGNGQVIPSDLLPPYMAGA